jgi:hypothetical protein
VTTEELPALLALIKLDNEIPAGVGLARPIAQCARRIGVKVKNPKAPAVKREAEEDWGR